MRLRGGATLSDLLTAATSPNSLVIVWVKRLPNNWAVLLSGWLNKSYIRLHTASSQTYPQKLWKLRQRAAWPLLG
jgi:hypothetical protein